MVNIIKQDVVIEESLKKKLKKQLGILKMRWMNILKNFITIKKIKKKMMVCPYKSSSF